MGRQSKYTREVLAEAVAGSTSIAGVPYRCSSCGVLGFWNGQPVILHIDHIDGNHLDSRPGNVRFLCPNCHSQTDSWADRNKNARTYRHPPLTAAPPQVADVSGLFGDVDGTRAS